MPVHGMATEQDRIMARDYARMWRARKRREADKFPQPQRKVGGEPCGECHIQPGETCDICGAVSRPPADQT